MTEKAFMMEDVGSEPEIQSAEQQSLGRNVGSPRLCVSGVGASWKLLIPGSGLGRKASEDRWR